MDFDPITLGVGSALGYFVLRALWDRLVRHINKNRDHQLALALRAVAMVHHSPGSARLLEAVANFITSANGGTIQINIPQNNK